MYAAGIEFLRLSSFQSFASRMRLALNVAACLCGASLSGCGPATNAALQSVQFAVQREFRAEEIPLDPKFQYLRLTRGRHIGWMWLGARETNAQGPVEVYYSSPGEVIRLQNGRVVGASGLTVEWRRVTVVAPSWQKAAALGAGARVERVRDVMPGYRAGIREQLELRVIPPPARTALQGFRADELTWFEEHPTRQDMSVRSSGDAVDQLPAGRYAVDLSDGQGTVVYAEQCLAHELCFAWQRWSAAMQKSVSEARAAKR